MALPKPTYPPVVPQSFLSSRDDRLMSLGLELYARYHPGAMQQQMYQALLEEETWQGAQEAEKVQRLVQERQRLLDLRTQVQASRATGGRVSGGGGGRTKGGASDAWAHVSKLQSEEWRVAYKVGAEDRAEIRDSYKLNRLGQDFNNEVMRQLGSGSTSGHLEKALVDASQKIFKGRDIIDSMSPQEWRVMAADLWTKIEGLPNFNEIDNFPVDIGGQVFEGGAPGGNVANLIDSYVNTQGWLVNLVREGNRPHSELNRDMRAELAGTKPRYPDHTPQDFDGDGTISEEERKAAAARDPDRLFEDRIAQLDAQIAAREQRSSPMARAARRTLGEPVEDELPYIPPEAIAAATAAGGPIAAEALPYAVRRFEQGQGTITPKTGPESFAEGAIKIGGRNFQSFLRAVNDRYGNDVGKVREAIAYYGAKFTEIDMQDQTIDPGARTGNMQEAAQGVEAAAGRAAPAPVSKQDPNIGRYTVLASEVGTDDLIPGVNTALQPGEQPGWQPGRGPGSDISPETNAPLYMTDPPYALASAPAPAPAPRLQTPAMHPLFVSGDEFYFNERGDLEWPHPAALARRMGRAAGGAFAPGGFIEAPLRKAFAPGAGDGSSYIPVLPSGEFGVVDPLSGNRASLVGERLLQYPAYVSPRDYFLKESDR